MHQLWQKRHYLLGGIMGNSRRVEPLMTIEELKKRYLFGVEIFDNDGNELSDDTLRDYISIAADMLEKDLDLSIFPKTVVEEKDYDANMYSDWGYLLLNEVPVRKVISLVAKYPDSAILEFPEQWFKIRKDDGQLRLLPGLGTYSGFMVNGQGQFLPELFRNKSKVPNLFEVTYETGFEDGKVPMAINAAIGLLAAIYALSIAGNLVLGAGIASTSLNIDGLSQAITTTSSAENSAYSATIKEYQKLLYGESINSPNRGLIRSLRDYYQGSRFEII